MLIKQILQTKNAISLLFLPSIILGLLATFSVNASNVDKSSGSDASSSCPAWLNETFRKLHSTEEINVCKEFAGRPLLIVNTASHCGFTYQFSGLESLHQRYKDKGLAVIGFSSNDFRQENKSEEKAATICYENYGVTFTMMSPTSVKGENANPIFKRLAQQSQAPSWNFNKFLVSSDGKKITHFGSSIAPDSTEISSAIEAVL
jgi:glutathione peroxidase